MINYSLIYCIFSLLDKIQWLKVKTERKNRKMVKPRVWGFNCYFLIVDSDLKSTIGEGLDSIGYNRQLKDQNKT